MGVTVGVGETAGPPAQAVDIPTKNTINTTIANRFQIKQSSKWI